MPAISPRLGAALAVLAFAAAIATATGCKREAATGAQPGQQANSAAPSRPAPEYVGGATCAGCHEQEHQRWLGSNHDLAMQEATADTVLGDFDDAEFTHHGVTSKFFRDGDKFVVRTDGPDGMLTDFEVAYTFGVEPLQQYLIAFPDGRYQALSLIWDARAKEDGGQRWYHLYGDEPIPHTDELHWTGPHQNWNFMCAACHSTNLQKGYDVENDRFETTWSEIDVSCEACHGPGSNHVAWANGGADASVADRGLVASLKQPHMWRFDKGAVTARRDPPLEQHTQVEACAPCHVRGGNLHAKVTPGEPLLDSHYVSLLDEGLYHADGQILDEVYVYGSFAQSKMYHAGVQCSNCHDPHSQKLKADGNALCAQCHMPTHFDTKAHHMHEPGSAGASCTACHMPQSLYMGVDMRADHSLRIPRPDLSTRLGTPNACNGCHDDKDSRWADQAIRDHRRANNVRYEPRPHYAEAIHAGRNDRADALSRLTALLADRDKPAIARATAASLLQRVPSAESLQALGKALEDPSAHVRRGAAESLEGYPDELLPELLTPLLDDPVRGVRTAAARVLATAPVADDKRARLQQVLDEYVESQLVAADRPWAHTNIGLLRARQNRVDEAIQAYRTALRIDPTWVPAWANLADAYRQQGNDQLGEQALREGLSKTRETASLHHALGLLLARAKRYDDAVAELRRAAEQRPEDPQFTYTWAIALHSSGKVDLAIEVLSNAMQRHPRNREFASALISYHVGRAEPGDRQAAIGWAQRLVEIAPNDPQAAEMLRRLQSGR